MLAAALEVGGDPLEASAECLAVSGRRRYPGHESFAGLRAALTGAAFGFHDEPLRTFHTAVSPVGSA